MSHKPTIHLVALLALVLAVCLKEVQSMNIGPLTLLLDPNADISPTEARNVREDTKYHFLLANKYMEMMIKAENDDNVDGYEKYLRMMRKEDVKWQEGEIRYNQIRDIIEQQVRSGELTIQGFTMRTNKGSMASVVDHLLGRVQA